MTTQWTRVDDDSEVLFEYPCSYGVWCERFNPPSAGNNMFQHGHVRISCDDGVGTVPAQVESRPFLAFLVQHCEICTDEEARVILALPESKQLLGEITKQEQEAIDSPELLKKWTSFGFSSAW